MKDVYSKMKKIYNDLDMMQLAVKSRFKDDLENVNIFIEAKNKNCITDRYISSDVIKKLDDAKDELREWVPGAGVLLKKEYSNGIKRFSKEYIKIAEEISGFTLNSQNFKDKREYIVNKLYDLNKIFESNMNGVTQVKCEHLFTSEYDLDNCSVEVNNFVNDIEDGIKSRGGEVEPLNRLMKELKHNIKDAKRNLEKIRGDKWNKVFLSIINSEKVTKDKRCFSRRKSFEEKIEEEMKRLARKNSDPNFDINNYKELKQVQFIANNNIAMIKEGLKTVDKVVNMWGEISCEIWGCIKYINTEEISARRFFKEFCSESSIDEWKLLQKYIEENDIA